MSPRFAELTWTSSPRCEVDALRTTQVRWFPALEMIQASDIMTVTPR